ncbi:MAG: Mur ligase [Acidobacteria bacterium]|nr:MAG: Mur ligase [Acidobacteriota bacterium]
MRVLDSRRLTGPSLLLDRAGAVLDIELSDAERDRALTGWRAAATRLLDAVGWHGQVLAMRSFAGGASVAFTAPADALYAATDLNDAAWASAQAELEGTPGPDTPATVENLRNAIAAERRPALQALHDAARARGVVFLHGEEQVSVGSGTGVAVWPDDAIPAPAAVDWSRVHEVPIALVTGSNGKTTTVRLLAAMAKAAGRVAGLTSTDGVAVGGRQIGEGDYSGPSGARLLLRDSAVEVAVLETARGGLLRRGLTVERADVAVITNIADDHLGEFGVQDLTTLAETKLLIARAIGAEGRVVLNADDPVLVAASRDLTAPIAWFSLAAVNPVVTEHVARGGLAAVLRGDEVTLLERGRPVVVAKTSEVPIAIGGAARYNVANALAAVLAAGGLGLPFEAICETLRRFGTDPADNPGRANLFEVGGVKVLMDYAHNPHGMEALAAAAAGVPSTRRLVMLGQAGDRSDEAIRDLARSVMALRPDRVVAKEMDRYLRGRAEGEIPGIMADEFRRLGLSEAQISAGDVEIRAVEKALEWARPGDLLILAVHQDRPVVATLLDRLRRTGWKAGEPLPR